MDPTIIRIICTVLSLVFLGLIIVRRRKNVE
jgi:hypothetical protein